MFSKVLMILLCFVNLCIDNQKGAKCQNIFGEGDVCGVRKLQNSPKPQRIVNGVTAEDGQWPWQAMILKYEKGTFDFACGGALISRQWVVTAAHCYHGEQASDYLIVLGAHFKNRTGLSPKTFVVRTIHCQESFIGAKNSFRDDICLMGLAGKVVYTENIAPVCLPAPGESVVGGETCMVSGWGDTLGTGNEAWLRHGEVEVISSDICDNWYKEIEASIPTTHFCAGWENGKVATCYGDSGGPLVCRNISQAYSPYVLHGITSVGYPGCIVERRPPLFTNVSKYIDWIESAVKFDHETDKCFLNTSVLPSGYLIKENGTIFRAPVTDMETWLYTTNADSTWHIETPSGGDIKIEFICFFQLLTSAGGEGRCSDYINVTTSTTDEIIHLCGNQLPQPIVMRRDMKIHFHSDSSDSAAGFVVRVTLFGGYEGTVSSPGVGISTTAARPVTGPAVPKVKTNTTVVPTTSNYDGGGRNTVTNDLTTTSGFKGISPKLRFALCIFTFALLAMLIMLRLRHV